METVNKIINYRSFLIDKTNQISTLLDEKPDNQELHELQIKDLIAQVQKTVKLLEQSEFWHEKKEEIAQGLEFFNWQLKAKLTAKGIDLSFLTPYLDGSKR